MLWVVCIHAPFHSCFLKSLLSKSLHPALLVAKHVGRCHPSSVRCRWVSYCSCSPCVASNSWSTCSDLCQAFGQAIAPVLAGGFLNELYTQGNASPASQTRTMAKYMLYHAKKLGVTA
eukprot:m.210317 g.210317  ORF g.210317 m.210317 type:complete len:118 (+) comp17142_c0_seq116:2657-3010(+)